MALPCLASSPRVRPAWYSRRVAPAEVAEAVTGEVPTAAESSADVVVKEASSPLHGMKASKAPLAVGVPGQVVGEAAAADAVVKEASPPLREANASNPRSAVTVLDEAVGEALAGAAYVALEEASLPLHGAEASTPPPAMAVADEVVPGGSPGKELRELSEQKVSPICSLLPKKQATPPLQ